MPDRRATLLRPLFPLLAVFALPAQAQDTDAWPDWLQEAMARETPALDATQFTVADGAIQLTVPGEPGELQAFDGGWFVTSDIGATSPLVCMLYVDATDLATLVASLGQASLATQERKQDTPIARKLIYSVDAGAIDGKPYVALEWFYTIGESAGLIKIRAAANGPVMQACTHDGVGYRETFGRAFETFVKSTRTPPDPEQPYYEEILVQRLNDLDVGVGTLTFVRDAEGDSKIVRSISSLIPVTPDTLNYSDATTVSWSTPDGELINAYSATTDNGELLTDLEIGRDADGDWVVAGTFQGKPIETTIDGEVTPLSELGQIRAARELFAGTAETTAFMVWLDEADPTRIGEARLTRDPEAAGRRARLEVGPLTMDFEFAADGAVTGGTMQMGPVAIDVERIWHRGTPE